MNHTLKFASVGEALTGLGLVVTPQLVIGLVFATTVEGAGIIACRLAGLALIGLALACWPGAAGNPARLGMLVYSFAAAIYLASIGIGGDSGIMLWPAAGAHAVISLLLMYAWFTGRKFTGTTRN